MAAGVAPGRPAVLVENASLPAQRVLPTTLERLPQAARELGSGPALIMVGEIYAELLEQAAGRLDAETRRTAAA